MHEIQFFADEGVILSPLERMFYKTPRVPVSFEQKARFLKQYPEKDRAKALGVRLRTDHDAAMSELEDNYAKTGGLVFELEFDKALFAPFINLKSLPPVIYGPEYISLKESLREITVTKSAQKHIERISFNFRKYGVPILQQLF